MSTLKAFKTITFQSTLVHDDNIDVKERKYAHLSQNSWSILDATLNYKLW